MINIRDLRIAPASLGCKTLLVDVMPAYEYKDGKRTETVTGYRYVVCLADTILSQIILDSTAAAEQIPKDARGRFILHDGTVFQAYWFDDTAGITGLHS